MDIALIEKFERLVIETNESAFLLMRPFYEKFGINYLKLSILRELLNDDAMTMNRLSERMGKAAANLSVVVANMEKEGYLKRVKSTSDKRVTFVHSTKKGRDISIKSYEFITEVFGKSFGEGEELKILVDCLEIYKHRLEKLHQEKIHMTSEILRF